jgi:osmoprotectant transport system permease protein
LASVGQLIGVSSLGYLFTDGYQRDFPTEIIVGLALVILLALVCDVLLVTARRLLTPWQVGRARRVIPLLTAGQRARELAGRAG